ADSAAWMTACLSLRPASFWPRLLRAQARVEQNDVKGAASDLEVAMRQVNGPVARYVAHLTQGRLAFVEKRWPGARDAFREAVRHQPVGEYQAHLNLAQVYRELSEHQAALTELDRAIACACTDASLYYTRAWVHMEMKQQDMARGDFEQAITLAARRP